MKPTRAERIDAHIRGIREILTEEEALDYTSTLEALNEMWEEICEADADALST